MSKSEITPSDIEILWKRMSAIYGRGTWEREHGRTDTEGVWYSGLRELTRDEVRAGLEQLKQQPRRFPPSLGEFFELCTRDRKRAPLIDREPDKPGVETRTAREWKAYQQIYKLKDWGMSNDELVAALAKADMQAMHKIVRRYRKEAGIPADRYWPPGERPPPKPAPLGGVVVNLRPRDAD